MLKRLNAVMDLVILVAVFGLGAWSGWHGRRMAEPVIEARDRIEQVADRFTFWN